MSKKISIVIISIIILISLILSIYIPNKEKIEEIENTAIKYSTIEKDGKIGVVEGKNTIIEPYYDEIIIINTHRDVFFCKKGENQEIINSQNEEIFKEYDNIQPIEISNSKYEKNILKYEDNGKYGLLSVTGKIITDAKYEEIFSLGYKEGEVGIKQEGGCETMEDLIRELRERWTKLRTIEAMKSLIYRRPLRGGVMPKWVTRMINWTISD